jgi:ABC-type nitrate/sulfonate/bicarbonate transport system permease component
LVCPPAARRLRPAVPVRPQLARRLRPAAHASSPLTRLLPPLRLAERLLLPVLDILQSIPVLGFLPGFVLGLVHLFPHRNLGLEIASVLMIFTGQVWNMTFSFYASLKSVPADGTYEGQAAQIRALSMQLLQELYGLDAASFDAKWREWVLKTYPKK